MQNQIEGRVPMCTPYERIYEATIGGLTGDRGLGNFLEMLVNEMDVQGAYLQFTSGEVGSCGQDRDPCLYLKDGTVESGVFPSVVSGDIKELRWHLEGEKFKGFVKERELHRASNSGIAKLHDSKVWCSQVGAFSRLFFPMYNESNLFCVLVILSRSEVNENKILNDDRLASTLSALSAVIHAQRFLLKKQAGPQAAISLLDNLTSGLFVVEHDRKVVFQNQASQKYLSGRNGLGLTERGTLYARNPVLNHSLTRAIEESTVGDSAASAIPPLSCVQSDGSVPFSIEVIPISSLRGASQKPRNEAAIVISDPNKTLDCPERSLGQLAGLTEAETEVVGSIVKGMSTSDIAKARRVQANTIQQQLKSIYSKVHVSSRADVVRMALLSADKHFSHPISTNRLLKHSTVQHG